MASAAERNLAAEVRAVEFGHRAFVQEGGWVKVTSDTYPGDKHYRVTFWALSLGPIQMKCEPAGAMAHKNDHHVASTDPGVCPCYHCACAMRRLEREGLARFGEDGRWYTTIEQKPSDPTVDPFDGL